ncbi:MAG: class I SAM-dependent methyltransferase [Alphaproteobacteria bacterium]|nr:class I SAM-dependent methyltransferase [Alphaproteobacteria bacterium]
MRPDVIDFGNFYRSRLGQVARHLIRRQVRAIWPNVRGLTVLGLGYATPYLRQFLDEAGRVVAVMPASQGVVRWPRRERNRVALAHEAELPLPDASVDRLLLVHGLENAEQVRPLLREIWRVLGAGGRLLILAPNRSGLWSRLERTPFGQGQPFSEGQLNRLMREAMFQPTQHARALYVPPFSSRFLMRAAPAWERIGERLAPTFAGVLLVEADKQIYVLTAEPKRQSARRPLAVIGRPRPVVGGAARRTGRVKPAWG